MSRSAKNGTNQFAEFAKCDVNMNVKWELFDIVIRG